MTHEENNGCLKPKSKTCPSCGGTFLCGPSGGINCWCSDLPNVMIIENGKDCLCPTCLKEAIDKLTVNQQKK